MAERREGLTYFSVRGELSWKPLPYNCGDSSGFLIGVALRRLVSIPRRLIFWFRVLSGIWNLSAASVWFQLVLSSMSTITLRSTSSMI